MSYSDYKGLTSIMLYIKTSYKSVNKDKQASYTAGGRVDWYSHFGKDFDIVQ